jgi:hypothetical protein
MKASDAPVGQRVDSVDQRALVGRLVVVIEKNLADVCTAGRGIHVNSIIGTLAAWTLRYCPFVFAGSERLAADFCFRFLASQLRSIERVARAVTKACAAPKPAQQDDNYTPF